MKDRGSEFNRDELISCGNVLRRIVARLKEYKISEPEDFGPLIGTLDIQVALLQLGNRHPPLLNYRDGLKYSPAQLTSIKFTQAELASGIQTLMRMAQECQVTWNSEANDDLPQLDAESIQLLLRFLSEFRHQLLKTGDEKQALDLMLGKFYPYK